MAPRTVQIGDDTLAVPGFGAMGLSAFYGKTDIEQGKATLRRAIEIGCTTFNTADVYGSGANEELIGSVLAEGDNRSKVFLITKFGGRIENGKMTISGSKEYAAQAIDASIKRLGTKPDAWILHRIDKSTPIEESVQAMEDARKAGKTRYIGLSECSADTLRRASKVAKIDFIEVEYSPWTTIMEENGVLDAAKELGIIVLAYSPLGRGFLTGRYKTFEDFQSDGDWRANLPRLQKEVWEENYKIVHEFQRISAAKNCTPGQLSLAWLMAQGPNIVPIPGTKSEKYLIENFNSTDVELSDEDLKELRKVIKKHSPKGARYADESSLDQ